MRERKLWPAAGLSKAEATALLDVQPDFASQKSWLEEELAQRGHLIDFYPKYYCELNFIERIWALAKQVIRADSDFTWNGLQAKVPATSELMATDHSDVVKRYARTAQRYIDAYHRKELSFAQVNKAVKRFSSHRRIGVNGF